MFESIVPFPLEVVKHRVSNAEVLKRQLMPTILNLVGSGKETLNPPSSWLCPELKTSFDNKTLNDELFSNNFELRKCLQESFSPFFRDERTQVEAISVWFNFYTSHDHQEWHSHSMSGEKSDLSFVFFLSYDPDHHAILTFKDPLHVVRELTQDAKIYGYSSTWAPQVAEGDLVIFPSYLEHSVKKTSQSFNQQIPRITVSGNMCVL